MKKYSFKLIGREESISISEKEYLTIFYNDVWDKSVWLRVEGTNRIKEVKHYKMDRIESFGERNE